jgi:hypothetical protein
MTFRPFVTCSFACGLLSTLLVGVVPLPAVAASSAMQKHRAMAGEYILHSLQEQMHNRESVCGSSRNIHLVIDFHKNFSGVNSCFVLAYYC